MSYPFKTRGGKKGRKKRKYCLTKEEFDGGRGRGERQRHTYPKRERGEGGVRIKRLELPVLTCSKESGSIDMEM